MKCKHRVFDNCNIMASYGQLKIINDDICNKCMSEGAAETNQLTPTLVEHIGNKIHNLNITNKIINVSKALYNNLDSKQLNDKIYEERLRICAGCSHYDKLADKCMICGCNCQGNNSILYKINMPNENCPIGKWKSV